mmetsp:Transcript_40994/g.70111  ORF Transcript_40994/g.70111 Transcript_40994/m.70111 type:complete len:212 (+) Transcript_40994:2-637(+)
MAEDDDAVVPTQGRKLQADTRDPWYETSRTAEERIGSVLESSQKNASISNDPKTLHLDAMVKEERKLEAALNKLLEGDVENTALASVNAGSAGFGQRGTGVSRIRARNLEADTHEPWHQSRRTADKRMKYVPEPREQNISTADVDTETLSLEAMVEAERELEAALNNLDGKVKKTAPTPNLQKEDKHYQSEILMLLDLIERDAGIDGVSEL